MTTDYTMADDLTVYVEGRRVGKVHRFEERRTTYRAEPGPFPSAWCPETFHNPHDAARAIMAARAERQEAAR